MKSRWKKHFNRKTMPSSRFSDLGTPERHVRRGKRFDDSGKTINLGGYEEGDLPKETKSPTKENVVGLGEDRERGSICDNLRSKSE